MNLRKNMEKLSKRNLQYFPKFYLAFTNEQIVNACVHNLNWTHFRELLRVSDENARLWYMNEATNLLYWKWFGVSYFNTYQGLSYGDGKVICICCQTAAYCYWGRRLFYCFCFYNIELKCYVLMDLQMGKITHQDVG